MRHFHQRRLTACIFLGLFLLALVVGCEGLEQGPKKGPKHGPKQDQTVPVERPKMIAFTATWCGPCQAQKPTVNEIEAAGVEVIRYDIDQSPDMARKYGITVVPTYFYYERGQQPFSTHQAADVLSRVMQRRR
jgi:thiol-disulfide isomerase/thioredoxin